MQKITPFLWFNTNAEEGISLSVECKTQNEVDHFRSALAQGGSESHCAWLKDKFGVFWQIVPRILIEMLRDKDPQRAKRVTQAMLNMDKMHIQRLKNAYSGS